MRFGRWTQVLGLALGLPSTILALGLGAHYLVERRVLSRELAYGLALLVIVEILGLIVWYGYKSKN